MEFFESFSKSMHWISMIFGLKEYFMVLDVCVRVGVHEKSHSRVTGPNGSKNTLR